MNIKILLIFFVLIGVSSSANAYIDCTGKVTMLSMGLDDASDVTISLEGGPNSVYLCQMAPNHEINGVPNSVCKTMYATLLAAKAAGKKMTIRFIDYSSCADVPSWGLAGRLGWTIVMQD